MFQLWSAFPYFFILAERGSGKSRVLKFMSMVCSMGQYWVSPRASPMFRSVEALQPTLCLDETEMLNDEDQAELVNLLNAGYERGAKVPRTNSEKMVVEFFDAYCPKALASTKPPSTVLESRCLKVPIRRTQRLSEFVRRDPTLKRKYGDSEEEHLLLEHRQRLQDRIAGHGHHLLQILRAVPGRSGQGASDHGPHPLAL
jgi:hypothetical protein